MVSAARATSAYAAITTQRVVLFQTRRGAFGPLKERGPVHTWERTQIQGAAVRGRLLILAPADGELLQYEVARSNRHLSTQVDFLDRIESLLGRSAAAVLLLESERQARKLVLAFGMAFAAVYLFWKWQGG